MQIVPSDGVVPVTILLSPPIYNAFTVTPCIFESPLYTYAVVLKDTLLLRIPSLPIPTPSISLDKSAVIGTKFSPSFTFATVSLVSISLFNEYNLNVKQSVNEDAATAEL